MILVHLVIVVKPEVLCREVVVVLTRYLVTIEEAIPQRCLFRELVVDAKLINRSSTVGFPDAIEIGGGTVGISCVCRRIKTLQVPERRRVQTCCGNDVPRELQSCG